MRRTFFDILDSTNFDFRKEYTRLKELFYDEPSVPIHGYLKPLAEYVDSTYFRDLKIRRGCTDLDDFASKANISRYDYCNDLDSLYVFCEFLYAVLPEEQIKKQRSQFLTNQVNTIKGNIKHILEKTNHELKMSPKYNNNYIIVEKNKATTLAAEIVEDIETAYDLIEYNHYALKGDLETKKKILAALGTYIEPILLSKVLSNNGYGKLESNVGFMLNNFHIRHNNKEGTKANDYIVAISDDDLETLYDKTYGAILSVIIINEHISVSKEIKTLKDTYTFKF